MRAACLRYFYEIICLIAICIVLALVTDYFYDYRFPAGSYLGLVAWTAIRVGTYWYSQHNGYPTSKVMWQLGLYFSIIIYTLLAIIFWLLSQDGSQYLTAMQSLATPKVQKDLGVFAVLIWFINRYGFSLGVWDAKRQSERILAKKKLANSKKV